MMEMDFPAGGLLSFYSSAEDVAAVAVDLADVVETTTAVVSSLS